MTEFTLFSFSKEQFLVAKTLICVIVTRYLTAFACGILDQMITSEKKQRSKMLKFWLYLAMSLRNYEICRFSIYILV